MTPVDPAPSMTPADPPAAGAQGPYPSPPEEGGAWGGAWGDGGGDGGGEAWGGAWGGAWGDNGGGGGGGAAGLNCREALSCVMLCEGPSCADECYYAASGDAQPQLSTLFACNEGASCGWFTACRERECWAELEGCE